MRNTKPLSLRQRWQKWRARRRAIRNQELLEAGRRRENDERS
jgi:hypothetical protein